MYNFWHFSGDQDGQWPNVPRPSPHNEGVRPGEDHWPEIDPYHAEFIYRNMNWYK